MAIARLGATRARSLVVRVRRTHIGDRALRSRSNSSRAGHSQFNREPDLRARLAVAGRVLRGGSRAALRGTALSRVSPAAFAANAGSMARDSARRLRFCGAARATVSVGL